MDKILDKQELENSIREMEDAQITIRQQRERITRYIVENELHSYFSINWVRLKREFGTNRR